MALIRQSNAAMMARDALVLDLGDLKRQADAMRARAQAEVDQLLAEGRAERERLVRQATEEARSEGVERGLEEGREQGRQEGRAAGLAELRETLQKLESGWTAALEGFENGRARALLEGRQDVLRLAMMLGEMVAKRALALKPEAVVDQVAAALALLSKPSRVTVTVHPDDLPLIQEALPALAQKLAAAAHAELLSDTAMERGGCIVRMPSGAEIDATIGTQLERIAGALLPDGAS
jgi:flagellar biosynthesis/type III secretory pathway protein FliH